MTLPEGRDLRQDSCSVVPGTTLLKIVQDFKHNLSSMVGVEIKSVTLNSKSEGDRNDNKLNYIMIPISFSVLVILCLIACCLHNARYVSIYENYITFKDMIFAYRLQWIRAIAERSITILRLQQRCDFEVHLVETLYDCFQEAQVWILLSPEFVKLLFYNCFICNIPVLYILFTCRSSVCLNLIYLITLWIPLQKKKFYLNLPHSKLVPL